MTHQFLEPKWRWSVDTESRLSLPWPCSWVRTTCSLQSTAVTSRTGTERCRPQAPTHRTWVVQSSPMVAHLIRGPSHLFLSLPLYHWIFLSRLRCLHRPESNSRNIACFSFSLGISKEREMGREPARSKCLQDPSLEFTCAQSMPVYLGDYSLRRAQCFPPFDGQRSLLLYREVIRAEHVTHCPVRKMKKSPEPQVTLHCHCYQALFRRWKSSLGSPQRWSQVFHPRVLAEMWRYMMRPP